jgi:23S rRNA maturation mini-RNase III
VRRHSQAQHSALPQLRLLIGLDGRESETTKLRRRRNAGGGKEKKNKFVVVFRLAAHTHTTQTLPIKSEGRED